MPVLHKRFYIIFRQVLCTTVSIIFLLTSQRFRIFVSQIHTLSRQSALELSEKKIKLNDIDIPELLGENDSHLRIIDAKYAATIVIRGDVMLIRGASGEVNTVYKIFTELVYILRRNGRLTEDDISSVIDLIDIKSDSVRISNAADFEVILYGNKEAIKPKSENQKTYCKLVAKNDLVFAVGPAGTGKTYLAIAMAVAALRAGEVSRIILSRPAVEAGESLGFLPGDLKEKLDPYMRPLTDALFQMVPPEKLKSLYEKNIIEITPLAYMRGRTLNNAFIILDEAQNATGTQMKMFLTRFGFGSKAIVTGDITQIDLPNKSNCGLIEACKVLQGVKDIGFINFDTRDVVRHSLVANIIKAYDHHESREAKRV